MPPWIHRLRHGFADGTFRRIARDAGLTTAATGVSAVLGLARSAIFARYLGVTDFGRLAIVLSTTLLARQLLSVRAWEWTTVELSKAVVARDAHHAHSCTKASYLVAFAANGLAFGLLMLLADVVCTRLLSDASLALLLRVNALSLLVAAFDDCSLAMMRVFGRYRWLAAYTIAASLLRLAAVAPAVALGGGLFGLVIAIVVSQAVISLCLYVAARNALAERFPGPGHGRVRDVLRDWRSHARMLAVLSATDTVKTFTSDADPLVIGSLSSAAAVGPYRAAYNVITGLQQLAVPLYMVFYPEMTKAAAARDAPAIRRLVLQTGIIGAVAAVVASTLLTIAAPLIVRLIYGSKFDGAVPSMQIMAWSLLIFSVQWANPLFVSLKRPTSTLWMVTAGAVVKLALLFALVPISPGVGAATAYLASNLAVIAAAVVLAYKALPSLRQLAAPVTAKPTAGA